ncbi:peptidase, partial [Micrococcus luteus]|nr:peptidase [Micrococcus luteus]
MTITTLTRKSALTGTAVLAALALAACGTTADNDDGSVSPGVDASSSVASTPTTDDASGSATSS